MNVIPSRYIFAYKDPVEKGEEGTYKVGLVLDGSRSTGWTIWIPGLPHFPLLAGGSSYINDDDDNDFNLFKVQPLG